MPIQVNNVMIFNCSSSYIPTFIREAIKRKKRSTADLVLVCLYLIVPDCTWWYLMDVWSLWSWCFWCSLCSWWSWWSWCSITRSRLGLGWDWDGLDLCVGWLYEHRFAVLIIIIVMMILMFLMFLMFLILQKFVLKRSVLLNYTVTMFNWFSIHHI